MGKDDWWGRILDTGDDAPQVAPPLPKRYRLSLCIKVEDVFHNNHVSANLISFQSDNIGDIKKAGSRFLEVRNPFGADDDPPLFKIDASPIVDDFLTLIKKNA